MTYNGPERRRDALDTAMRLQALELKFERLLDDMNRMHTDNVALLKRHDDALHGNGKSGLVEDVRAIKSIMGWARWVIVTGGGLVVIDVAQFFLDLYRKSAP